MTGVLDDRKFLAAVDMVMRTGALGFAIRCCEEAEPAVWVATAEHRIGGDGRPTAADQPGTQYFEAGAALDPSALCSVSASSS